MACHQLVLERDGFNQPWGFRMVGGLDVGAPLSIARVTAGTASEGFLKVGDIITVIKGKDTTKLSHQEASDMFINAGNRITLTVARGMPEGTFSTGSAAVDGRVGERKTSQGKLPARKFADEQTSKPISMGEYIHTKSAMASGSRPLNNGSPVVQSPASCLPVTSFIRPKTPVEQQAEDSARDDMDEKSMIHFQPYRTTPLITPGAKVKRDNPINSCYLSMHPDPQVIHHQFNSPMDMYSPGNAAQSLRDQTGFSTSVDGVKKEFSIQNSQALKAIMEDNADGGQRAAAPPQKPKSHVVYDLHEAKGGVWPPPGLDEQRSLPPPADRPVRQMVEEPRRELPSSPTQECSFQTSAKNINEKIAQSYSFNKVMWAMDPLERI